VTGRPGQRVVFSFVRGYIDAGELVNTCIAALATFTVSPLNT
jgi:hypothetical protein